MGIAENHAYEREQARLDGIVEGLCIAKALAENAPLYFTPDQLASQIQQQICLRTSKPIVLAESAQNEPHILAFKRA